MTKEISIKQFMQAIEKLPSDKAQNYPGKWYTTQKEHWRGWLSEYHGAGAYVRQVGKKRGAKFAYNHIVNHEMLLWLMKAARVKPKLVKAAQSASDRANTMQEKSAAIRKHVSWQEVSPALWGSNEGGTQANQIQNRAFSVRQPFAELIISAKKHIEYRSVATNIRGRVYIYASQKPVEDAFEKMNKAPGDFSVGVLVGTVEIVGCTGKPGNYQWHLANPKRLKRAIKPDNRPLPTWFKPLKK